MVILLDSIEKWSRFDTSDSPVLSKTLAKPPRSGQRGSGSSESVEDDDSCLYESDFTFRKVYEYLKRKEVRFPSRFQHGSEKSAAKSVSFCEEDEAISDSRTERSVALSVSETTSQSSLS